MTLQQAAQSALDVQDACNLSGVLGTMHNIVTTTLWDEARSLGKGTRWVNQHPICYMFLYKLMSLNGHETLDPHYDIASELCKQLAEGKVMEQGETESTTEQARR